MILDKFGNPIKKKERNKLWGNIFFRVKQIIGGITILGIIAISADLMGIYSFFKEESINKELLEELVKKVEAETKLRYECARLREDLDNCIGKQESEVTYAARVVLNKSDDLYAKGQAALLLGQFEDAIKYNEEAMRLGNIQAVNSKGEMYYYQAKRTGDETMLWYAVEYFRIAAEQGMIQAQYNYAVMNYYGESVEKNKIKAYKWFKKAADNGHAKSKEVLNAYYKE
jgi:tetratricopeptide (TPR) repeat protein